MIVLDDASFERQFQFQESSLPMLVCLCHPASERDVDACIENGARSVDDVGEMCGAGTGCGSCVDDLRERLERAGFSGEADRPRGCPGSLVSVRSRDGNAPSQ